MKQRISTPAIDAAIATLYSADRLPDGFPSVRQVAELLKERYGHRGETKRICESLTRAREATEPPSDGDEESAAAWRHRAISIAQEFQEYQSQNGVTMWVLLRALLAMTERAERSEAREESTQSHWMMKVDTKQLELDRVSRELAATKHELAIRRGGISSGNRSNS